MALVPAIGAVTAPSLTSTAEAFGWESRRIAMLQDAEIAWRYFLSGQTRGIKRGLAPAAVWPEGRSFGRYAILTMWDMGSLILATVSAKQLDLISVNEFDERVTNILSFLKRSNFRWKKARLPNFRTNVATANSVENGYDSTDIGRLLIALYVLDQVTGGAYHVKRLVSQWDIEQTIVDGAAHDIKSSRMIASRAHNYIHYVARAHKLWGIDVKTGYDAPINLGDKASRKAFLTHIAKNGTIATEPSVNETIELGLSNHAHIMADTLYMAQQERFRETSHLTCVSEAPIDRKPWFTYQAFNPAGDGWWRWPVHSVVTSKEWQTEAFAEQFRMVNAKAAYLWSATRDDSYAGKLREHVSTNGRTDRHGFRPGIYEKSGGAPNVMDINTNAMVLQSVAYVKSGRRPMDSWKV